jgi:hypothetical protein
VRQAVYFVSRFADGYRVWGQPHSGTAGMNYGGGRFGLLDARDRRNEDRGARRALALVVLMVAIAGCGSESKSTGSAEHKSKPHASLSKPQYIQKADAICSDYRPRLRGLRDEARAALNRRDFDAAAGRLNKTLDLNRAQFEKLTAIPRPEGGRDLLTKLFGKAKQAMALFEKSIEPLRHHDIDRFATLASQAFSAANQEKHIAAGYGFKVCGSG